MKITRGQAQQLAISERDDIGGAAIGDEQRELAEKIAAAELDGCGAIRTSTAPEEMKYIASPRSPLWTMTSSRNREARPQHPRDRAPSLRVESREHRHATNEIIAL